MEADKVDMSGRYRVSGYSGVAFYLLGWVQEWTPYTYTDTDEDGEEFEADSEEGEYVDSSDMVFAVMVGDDRKHVVDVRDLTPLAEDDYCGGCGQTGCEHDGRPSE